MKKLLSISVFRFMAFFMFSCGGGSTPKAVAEQAVKCIQSQDYKGYIDLTNLNDNENMTSEEKEKSKEQLALLLEDKGKKEYDRKQGIKDYEINDETIDGDKATVKVKIIYGNGEEKEETMSLVKNKDGKWRIPLNK